MLFPAEKDEVKEALIDLCRLASFHASISTATSVSTHASVPSTSALSFRSKTCGTWSIGAAVVIAEEFGVPGFLYEKSEKGRHEADLPTLRKGGFGLLLEWEAQPRLRARLCPQEALVRR